MRRLTTVVTATLIAAAPLGGAAAAPPLTPEQVATYRVDTDITVANAGFEFIAVARAGAAAPDLVIRRAGPVRRARRARDLRRRLRAHAARPAGQINMVACVGPAATSPKLPATVTMI
jgi:hypothetical protein